MPGCIFVYITDGLRLCLSVEAHSESHPTEDIPKGTIEIPIRFRNTPPGFALRFCTTVYIAGDFTVKRGAPRGSHSGLVPFTRLLSVVSPATPRSSNWTTPTRALGALDSAALHFVQHYSVTSMLNVTRNHRMCTRFDNPFLRMPTITLKRHSFVLFLLSISFSLWFNYSVYSWCAHTSYVASCIYIRFARFAPPYNRLGIEAVRQLP